MEHSLSISKTEMPSMILYQEDYTDKNDFTKRIKLATKKLFIAYEKYKLLCYGSLESSQSLIKINKEFVKITGHDLYSLLAIRYPEYGKSETPYNRYGDYVSLEDKIRVVIEEASEPISRADIAEVLSKKTTRFYVGNDLSRCIASLIYQKEIKLSDIKKQSKYTHKMLKCYELAH